MTTTAITGVKRWCYQWHIWCEFANEIGRCVITACVQPQLIWVTSTEYKGGDTE